MIGNLLIWYNHLAPRAYRIVITIVQANLKYSSSSSCYDLHHYIQAKSSNGYSEASSSEFNSSYYQVIVDSVEYFKLICH